MQAQSSRRTPAAKMVILVVLITMLLGMAHLIEVTARPDSGKRGQRVEGGHDH